MMKSNTTMLVDFYELTMANAYFLENKQNDIAYFDLFFRDVPDGGGYAIFAGLESIVDYIQSLRFEDQDIAFLKQKDAFSEAFLDYLKTFKFSGDIFAFPEGSVVFPNEPILTVRANIIEAQIIETFLLQAVNHQSLIATKATRMKYAAKGRPILEMGARRSHGATSSNLGARASYIGGIDGTSNVLADQLYGVPSGGTMAHSFIHMFDSEYEAFKAYANHYPDASTFLVDTYDTLKSGVPHAIQVIKEVLLPRHAKNYAIRIDSGDLTYLAKRARQMLDDAGLEDCRIVVSNSLDEWLIEALLQQGAPIDLFGVGERLITAKSDPVFGGVYKLVAVEHDHEIIPKIKISNNEEKITTPHFKKVYRIYDKSHHAEADWITLYDEPVDTGKPLTIFDPQATWKRKTFERYDILEMHQPIFLEGRLVYKRPRLSDIRAYVQKELETLWEEVRRFENPHAYYVDLSERLWNLKQTLIKSEGNR